MLRLSTAVSIKHHLVLPVHQGTPGEELSRTTGGDTESSRARHLVETKVVEMAFLGVVGLCRLAVVE